MTTKHVKLIRKQAGLGARRARCQLFFVFFIYFLLCLALFCIFAIILYYHYINSYKTILQIARLERERERNNFLFLNRKFFDQHFFVLLMQIHHHFYWDRLLNQKDSLSWLEQKTFQNFKILIKHLSIPQ